MPPIWWREGEGGERGEGEGGEKGVVDCVCLTGHQSITHITVYVTSFPFSIFVNNYFVYTCQTIQERCLQEKNLSSMWM